MNEITVVYEDGIMGCVPVYGLQKLIDNDVIVKFQRQDGWVYPGLDPVRRRSHSSYNGPERRNLYEVT